MPQPTPPPLNARKILATDLDGTLIPLAGNQQNLADLETLTKKIATHEIETIFVTGRHLASVLSAIEQYKLPTPDWILCDVGSSMHRFDRDEQKFEPDESYAETLTAAMRSHSLTEIKLSLKKIAELELQEPEKQSRFKLSFYSAAEKLSECRQAIEQQLQRIGSPVQLITSIDPFENRGLIDILPPDVSKAFAISWWLEHNAVSFSDNRDNSQVDTRPIASSARSDNVSSLASAADKDDPRSLAGAADQSERLVFAGDSGNDLAALTAGYRTIVVGNASGSLKQTVTDHHQRRGWSNHLFIASAPATSGVLAGCEHFGLF